MRIAHLADLHLGFRQFNRVTPAGRNVRETDVMRTFHLAADRLIRLAPEMIVIAGDICHSPRPSNATVIGAFEEFSRLMAALPQTVVVMIGGNHDIGRSADTGCILQLFAKLGIHVVERDATRLTFADLNLSVLAVPDAPQTIRPAFVPDPACRYNVCVLHGEVEGMTTRWTAPEGAALQIRSSEIQPAAWSYVALGHYHVLRQLAPNMAYSGSIDYTSTNPWGELEEERENGLAGKGFVERNLDTGEQMFHPLPPSRHYIDLPRFSAHEMSVVDIDEAIRAAVESCEGGIDGQIVRLVVTDVQGSLVRELDFKAIKGYKLRALNFYLDLRRATSLRFGSPSATAGIRQKSLEEITAEFFAAYELPVDIDRARLTALANTYLADATERATPEPAPAALGDAEAA